MEPFSISMILAAAAGAAGNKAVTDLYDVAKHAIKDLFGQDKDLLEALELVDAKPTRPFSRMIRPTTPSVPSEIDEPASLVSWSEPMNRLFEFVVFGPCGPCGPSLP